LFIRVLSLDTLSETLYKIERYVIIFLVEDHAALVVKKNNRILFIRRSETKKTLPNTWAFPSGTKKPDEKITDTAKREAEEELGIKVGVEKVLATRKLPEFKVRLHFVVCNIKSGKPAIKDPREINLIQWMTFEEFFEKYNDDQIGHGLIYLRRNPDAWDPYFSPRKSKRK
jgi:8-oxo-dGTP pyrophosphatase MutT (NUDIX family)